MDIRDQEGFRTRWYKELDEKRMRAVMEITVLDDEREDESPDEIEVLVPFRYEVCDLCSGRGSHVNPAIDAGGLSDEDFRGDPDFAENYFEGMYDVSCYRCGGKRIEAVLNDEVLKAQDPALHARVMRHMRAIEEIAYERIAESRYQY
jgi:hypothetical protein